VWHAFIREKRKILEDHFFHSRDVENESQM
jgi:hypothetical protein